MLHIVFISSLTTEQTSYLVYEIANKAKAAVLRNEITENELVYSMGIPDSLSSKQNQLSGNISAYNNLILEELRKKEPDSKKIALWKDAVFEMNREDEKVKEIINSQYPQINILLHNTEPVPLSEIQKALSNKETVIDYFLSNQYNDGKRKMYTFLITKKNLEFLESDLDSSFAKNADIIRKFHLNNQTGDDPVITFTNYTSSLNYMYEKLIKPVEKSIHGTRLIIIPDEELSWLPFEAFLKSKPTTRQYDFEGLEYLINDYSFSYGYSTSLIFRQNTPTKGGRMVYAFSPDYSQRQHRLN